MRQAACSFCFPEETLAILKFLFRGLAGQRNGFYRDDAIDLGITRFVDNTPMAPRPSSARISYRPKRSLLRSSIGVIWFQTFVVSSQPDVASVFSSDAVVASTPIVFVIYRRV